MRGYRALLEKEMVELWRTYRLVITCGLFTALGVGLPILVRYLRGITRMFGQIDPELGVGKTDVPDVVEALVKALWLLGPIAAVVLTMGSVAGERRARTAAFVLAKPISRAAFVWAKFVAIALVLALATALAVFATWLYTGILFAPQDPFAWVQLWLLAWLAALVFVAVTLAASTALGSAAGAAAVGLTTFGAVTLASTVITLNAWLPTGLGGAAQGLVLGELSGDVDPFRTVLASIGVLFAGLGVAWVKFARDDL